MKKKKIIFSSLLFCAATLPVAAQNDFNYNEDSQFRPQTNRKVNTDSLGSDKEIPKGIRVWTVDERFGDTKAAVVDTLQHMYMNSTFTEGLRGEYNTLGNMGTARLNRIFIDRRNTQGNFIFTEPYDYIVNPVSDFHFTNTYSPITNITLNSCGDKVTGEDDFKAMFAVNANKRLGAGFRFDYKYGRGYYNAQSTSHFKYTMWASYLGDRYQAHFLFSTNHEKMTENGGITNDDYIKHPEIYTESFATNEIPTVLEQNWNRLDNQHIFFTHRYNVGFSRKVKMTEEEIKAKKFAMASKKENAEEEAKEEARKKAKEQGKKFDEKAYDKQQGAKFSGRPDGAKIAGDEPAKDSDAKDIRNDSTRIAVNGKAAADSLLAIQKKNAEDSLFYKSEYVPVTSFIHTVKFDNYRRIYEAYQTPADYYLKEYYDAGRLTGDSIYDQTKHWHMKNTFAIAMLEGFNKWAKAGLKAFASYDLRHYELPTMEGGFEKFNEHALSVGGQLSKQEGKTLHYNAVAEIGLTGVDAGTLAIDGNVDVNIPFLGDTLQVRGDAFFHRETPSFYYRNYHARHLWWENDLDKTIHTRIMGTLSFPKTRTKLRVAVDEIKNYTYFSQSYDITEKGLRTGVMVTPMQESGGINLLTAQLEQNFRLGILNWENQFTYQHSSKESVLPVPAFNAYTNLYIKFKVVKVLNVDLGADMRYFTSYEAPDYSPYMGQYTVQGNGENNVKIGNYPIVNVYANVHIKHTRFFVMMSHINAGQGDKNYFFAPHYPMNERVFRIGVSWNFFN
ncbi:putative porin [Prevotella copri]|uniref:putative porin n=1 Tax=Segatella copri TaxID=165179 RepID=UPI001C46181B|nr:putative porin [Segatella copri]MBW0033913.1 putative porin [Segatella copri]